MKEKEEGAEETCGTPDVLTVLVVLMAFGCIRMSKFNMLQICVMHCMSVTHMIKLFI